MSGALVIMPVGATEEEHVAVAIAGLESTETVIGVLYHLWKVTPRAANPRARPSGSVRNTKASHGAH